MARIKLDMPDNYIFSTELPVRISDINYGGHLSNDAMLSMLPFPLSLLKHILSGAREDERLKKKAKESANAWLLV